MKRIIDFTKYKENKEVTSVACTLITRACLQSLFDVTQEINAVLGAWQSVTPADGLEVLNAEGGENENLYKLRLLLDIHGKNLLAISRAIDDVIVEPTPKRKIELAKEINNISYKTGEKAFVCQYLEEMNSVIQSGS